MAVFGVSLTFTVISVDDGLLRTSTGCAGPSSSLTLYVDWLKLTETAIKKAIQNYILMCSYLITVKKMECTIQYRSKD